MDRKIKIASISDIHGFLMKPELFYPGDVLTISGDIFPLDIQRNSNLCEDWFNDEFAPWILSVPFSRVIIIAGNHDFYFEETHSIPEDVDGKLIYLEDSSYEYMGVTFYGCPWCEGPYGWAFCPNRDYGNSVINKRYIAIPDCDILLTHQPPKFNNLGVSMFWNNESWDYSSYELFRVISNKKIVANFCGHVHSGEHTEQTYNGNGMKLYNVSMMNENYRWAYLPTYTEFNVDKKEIKTL